MRGGAALGARRSTSRGARNLAGTGRAGTLALRDCLDATSGGGAPAAPPTS